MQLAVCQFHPEWEEKESNFLKAKKYVIQAADRGADLILFPEMSFTGFTMNLSEAEEPQGATAGFLKGLAEKSGIAIGAGYGVRSGAMGENHYSIVNKNGKIILDYTKIHPFSYSGEDRYYRGGSRLYTAKVEDVELGTVICYDLRFPEIFQALCQRAHVILVPANWPAGRREHWEILLKARAIETQSYIVGINCVGDIHGIYYSGGSCVINPLGEVLKESREREELFFCDIQDDIEHYRKAFPVSRDRKPNLYGKIGVEHAEEIIE